MAVATAAIATAIAVAVAATSAYHLLLFLRPLLECVHTRLTVLPAARFQQCGGDGENPMLGEGKGRGKRGYEA